MVAMIHVPKKPTGSAVLGYAQVQALAVAGQSVFGLGAEREFLDFSDFCSDLEVSEFVDDHVLYFGSISDIAIPQLSNQISKRRNSRRMFALNGGLKSHVTR